MAKKLIILTFASEAEDASWHESHKQELEEEVERRMKSGRTLTPAEAMADARAKRNLRPVTTERSGEGCKLGRPIAKEMHLQICI